MEADKLAGHAARSILTLDPETFRTRQGSQIRNILRTIFGHNCLSKGKHPQQADHHCHDNRQRQYRSGSRFPVGRGAELDWLTCVVRLTGMS